MAHPLVSVRLPPALLEASERIAQFDGYASTQEFIRDAVRRQVQGHDLTMFKQLQGIAKGKKIKRLTRAQREALAHEFMRETTAQQQARMEEFLRPRTRQEFDAFLAAKKKRQQ